VKINRDSLIAAFLLTLLFVGLAAVAGKVWLLPPGSKVFWLLPIGALLLFAIFYYGHTTRAIDDLERVDRWHGSRIGIMVRKAVLTVVGFGSGWYAIENQSWLAGIFCFACFVDAAKSSLKKPI